MLSTFGQQALSLGTISEGDLAVFSTDSAQEAVEHVLRLGRTRPQP